MNNNSKPSLETWLRRTAAKPLDKIASALLSLGLQPNHITIFGMLGSIAAGYLIIRGQLLAAGLLALFMAPLDAVDGAMARKRGKLSRFGAFLDSVVDRYDELIILGALLVYFYSNGCQWGVILSYLAAAGSVLVSYTRARAEGLGLTAKVGVLTRIERAIVLIAGLLFGFPFISVGIIAILANLTALQRILCVRAQAGLDLELTKNEKE